MRTFDSPINSSHLNHGMKLKNHESPITKLTNLTDVRTTSHHTHKNQTVLNDRSNQIFIPQNAAKYIEQPYDRRVTREKEIEEIRKKYYDNSHQKSSSSRPVPQKYDRYEIYRDSNGSKRMDENNNNYREINSESVKKSVLLSSTRQEDMTVTTNRHNQSSTSNSNTNHPSNQPQPNTKTHHHLDRISQASNSNYQTITKTLETLSPERHQHRAKSSYVVDDNRSGNKRKAGDLSGGCYFVESFRNRDKENQERGSVIKETTSVYNQSATRGSHANSYYYERDSGKESKVDTRMGGRNQPSSLKPFSIEDSTYRQAPQDVLMRPASTAKHTSSINSTNNYPTIYDNFLPKHATPSTTQKTPSTIKQTELYSRPRTYTDHKKYPNDKVVYSRANDLCNQQAKRRVLKFEDDDKMKEIERRLKEREVEFKKREENLRNKCDSQYDRRTDLSQQKTFTTSQRNPQASNSRANQLLQGTKSTYPQQERQPLSRPNVQKQIERLSMKIKEFEDKKKELNINGRTNITMQNSAQYSKATQNIQQQKTGRDFEDARKALEEYRQGARVKSTSEVYQVSEYQIPGSVNNEQSSCTIKLEEGQGFYKKYPKNREDQSESTKKSEFLSNTKPMYSERTLPTPKRKESSGGFSFQLFKIESQADVSSSHTSKVTVTSSTSKTNAKECKNQFQIYRRTDDGIEQRKKRLQENVKHGATQQLKRLVSMLSQQTIHDEEFRNCKIWFQNERSDNKWRELKRELKECKSAENKYTELKDGTIAEFHICEDQNNPFFSVNQQSKFTYQALVRSFVTAKTFWEENIVKKYSKQCLKAEGFVYEKFDLQKKGFINMEDFVRFLNFESGNFYRNRDLVLIFKRILSQGTQIPEKTLTMDRIFSVIAH